MNTLGSGHILVNMDCRPGETVLWEGGASRGGTVIRLARMAVFPFLLLVFYAILLGPMLLMLPQDRPRQRSAAQTQSTHNTPNPSEAEQHPSIPPAYPVIALTLAGVFLSFAIGLPILVAVLQSRNAWYILTSERVCFQSGAFTRSLSILDLDKVLSIEVSSSLLERWFSLQSIEFLHAGGKVMGRGAFPWQSGEKYLMAFLPLEGHLVSDLLNTWLPRDNRPQ